MGHRHRKRDKFDLEGLVPVIVSVLRQFNNNKETKAAPVALEAIDTKALESITDKSDLKESLLKVLSRLDTSDIKDSNVLDLIKRFKKD